MRHLLFAVFFSVGVTLMVVSGYVPRAAHADGEAQVGEAPPAPAEHVRPYANHRRLVRPTRPRRIPAPIPHNDDFADPRTALDVPPDPFAADVVDTAPADAETAAASSGGGDVAAYVDTSPTEPGPVVRPVDEGDSTEASEDGGEEPLPELAEVPDGPVADAGNDKVVWIGWDELALDGRGSEGHALAYQWQQVEGEPTLQIQRPRGAQTTAVGLPSGAEMSWQARLYTFELTVTDVAGRAATDDVSFVVLAGPELDFTPKAERRFEERDGYWVGVYEAWTTNTETYESAFRIESPVGLTLSAIGGNCEFDLSDEVEDGTHVYFVVLLGAEGASSSWAEFLVNTAEGVPGVIRLGVSWDGLAQRPTKPDPETRSN